MEVQIRVQRRIPGVKSRKIKGKLKKVLRDLDFHDGELSVLLTDDRRIADLNNRYLGRQGPTNVLAFPMEEGQHARFDTRMFGGCRGFCWKPPLRSPRRRGRRWSGRLTGCSSTAFSTCFTTIMKRSPRGGQTYAQGRGKEGALFDGGGMKWRVLR